MPSAFDDLFADSAAVSLMDLHGRSVTRWPHGHEAEAETVTAMWSGESSGQSGSREADQGSQAVIIEGTLTVLAGQTVTNRDSWLIDGWRYHTQSIGHIVAGLRYIRVKHTDKITTSRTPNIR